MMRSNLRSEISPDGVGLKLLDESGGMQLTYVELRVTMRREEPCRLGSLPFRLAFVWLSRPLERATRSRSILSRSKLILRLLRLVATTR